jgi:hypothetical protein
MYMALHEPVPEGPLSLVNAMPRENKPNQERAAYLGEYNIQDAGQMSTEWFAAQGDNVRLRSLLLDRHISD